MDEARLKRLIRMVEDSDIEELEIDRPFGRIRITKRRAAAQTVTMAAPAAASPLSAPQSAAEVAAATPVTPDAAPDSRDPNLVAIAAPMVGTFYSAPAPGAKPYLSVGDKVSVGQVVCIVEAMKLMNEVQSEVAGTVRETQCENGQAVEYGQDLFFIDPV